MSVALERIIVTGASGFVGRSLVAQLDRSVSALHFSEANWRDQVRATDFSDATVFHLAARVHDFRADGTFEFDNAVKTRELAQAAAGGGARRFVFASTVKVHGEESTDRPLRATDPVAPADEYARSKWNAEIALAEIARESRLEVATVRAPLVYGPNAKGNLRTLLRAADSGWWLPFGAIDNRRSFVHVDDLARLLLACATAPEAAGAAFLAAHAQSVSTARLVATMRACFGRPRRMVRVSPRVLELGSSLLGQSERARRLTRSLEVDPSETTRVLGWTAQVGFDTAVEDMARAYHEAHP